MLDQLQVARNKEEQIVLHHVDAVTASDEHWYEAPCKLDGSVEAMHQCLATLATLTCQDGNDNGAPTFELQFGEIVTVTSLLTIDGCGYLSITALLPRATGGVPHSMSHLTMSTTIKSTRNLLWHADNGCYVLTRTIAVSSFCDERDVLDAIADTSDEAIAWQTSIAADTPAK